MSDIELSVAEANWVLLVLAPFVGSFLGVVIRRLPEGQPIIWARSACEHCVGVLPASDLIPLVSWVLLQGRCRRCGHPLGWFYPGIELAALAVAVIAVTVDGSPLAWLDCLLGWPLLALAWIDLRHWLLPDILTLPLVVIGLVVATIFYPEALLDRAVAAVLGYVSLRLISELYQRLRHREGLGQGDAKLLAAGGAWLGVAALPQVILVSAIAALIVAGALSLVGVRMRAHSALPFGPFLAAAIWALWLFGPAQF